jgi:putative tricarboxylic transport membrane protein
MKKANIPAAPMLMALLMGPMMERSLYQALNLSHGNMMVFIQRPISATLLAVIVLMSVYVGIRAIRGKKSTIEEAEE